MPWLALFPILDMMCFAVGNTLLCTGIFNLEFYLIWLMSDDCFVSRITTVILVFAPLLLEPTSLYYFDVGKVMTCA